MATGAVTHVDTTGSAAKPNGSILAYHDGQWWGAFRKAADNDIGIFDRNTGTWTNSGPETNDRTSDRPDFMVDSANNRGYVLGRHGSSPEITSMTYAAGVWTIDPNVNKVHVAGIDGENDCCLAICTRWTTPTLFAFDAPAGVVTMRHSTDHGQTWGTQTTIVDSGDGRTTASANCDAIEFSWNDGGGSANYVCVVYGENGGVGSQFGRSYLKEGDDPTVAGNWTHQVFPAVTETPSETPQADDHVSLMRDGSETNNRLYVAVKNGTGALSNNAVFSIDNDASATIAVAAEGVALSGERPLLQFDATNGVLYYTGADAGSNDPIVYYTADEGTSLTFASQGNLFEDTPNTFSQVSGSHAPVDSVSNMLFAAGSSTSDMWESEITITAASGGSIPPLMHHHRHHNKAA